MACGAIAVKTTSGGYVAGMGEGTVMGSMTSAWGVRPDGAFAARLSFG
jgi:hypothetical protein